MTTPGVHVPQDEVIEVVVDALHDRLDQNAGDTVHFKAGRFTREHEIDYAGQKVTAALGALADEPQDGLVVEHYNPDANRPRWRARREEGAAPLVADGGVANEVAPDSEQVVLARSGGNGMRRQLHLPDESGTKPLCSIANRENVEWLVKDRAVYPPGYLDWCEQCLNERSEASQDSGMLVPAGGRRPTELADTLTLFERQSDGQRTLKVGTHDDRMVDDYSGQLTTDKAVGVLNLDEPVSMKQLTESDPEDLPELARLFLRGEDKDGDSA